MSIFMVSPHGCCRRRLKCVPFLGCLLRLREEGRKIYWHTLKTLMQFLYTWPPMYIWFNLSPWNPKDFMKAVISITTILSRVSIHQAQPLPTFVVGLKWCRIHRCLCGFMCQCANLVQRVKAKTGCCSSHPNLSHRTNVGGRVLIRCFLITTYPSNILSRVTLYVAFLATNIGRGGPYIFFFNTIKQGLNPVQNRTGPRNYAHPDSNFQNGKDEQGKQKTGGRCGTARGGEN